MCNTFCHHVFVPEIETDWIKNRHGLGIGLCVCVCVRLYFLMASLTVTSSVTLSLGEISDS